MIADAELLRRYADSRAEDAFAELVRRRVNLVYSVALRQVGGDAHLAEDVTQRVFADLASKARALSGHAVLSGWLYRAAQFAATDVVRAERRRRTREQEVQAMNNETSANPAGDAEWEKFRPVLDQAMSELDDADRDAVALRFFEERSFAEVGAALRVSEEAARKRVSRALDRLHALLARRGVNSTAAALGIALAGQAAVAAPAGLATATTVAALAGATAGAAGTVVSFMAMTKLQIGIAGAVVLLGTTGFVLQTQSNEMLRQEAERLSLDNEQLPALKAEKQRLALHASETDALRKDSSELARLKAEAETFQQQIKSANRDAAPVLAEKPRWPNSQPTYEARLLDQQPVPAHRATLNYPDEFRDQGIEGEVLVSLIVDLDGNAQDVRAVSTTHHQFAVAALEAMRKWKFKPGQKSGQAVNARVEIPVEFTVDKTNQPMPNWF